MEVLHRHIMEEDEVEVSQLVVERGRTRHFKIFDDKIITDTTLQWSATGENLAEDVKIPQIVNAVIDNGNGVDLQDTIVSELNAPVLWQTSNKGGDKGTGDGVNENGRNELDLGDSDEEVVELEFERAVEKVHTHTAYCPNCSSQITRVVLRRKRREAGVQSPADDQSHRELFGCFSCFSIFMPSGNGLNPLSIFGNKEKHENTRPVQGNNAPGSDDPASSGSTKEKEKIIKQGNMFDFFWIFGKRRGETNATNLEGHDLETSPPLSVGSFILDINDGLGNSPAHSQELGQGRPARAGTEQQTENNGEQNIDSRHFESIEILKCVVYGGLVESITSLGVLSSAVSSGATKLNIIALGLANVISGLFIIGHSLMDLKNDSDHHGRRYQGLLGRREHFLLHATIAILSFLIFGLMPPVMYGFTEIWEVGAASFACIFILAIAKAYVKRAGKFSEYIKTILYYVMMAITASGIAYVVGDQIKMLIERLGWFEPSQAGPTFVPAMSWSSY